MPTELAPEGARNTEAVAHGDPSCQGNVPVAQAGIFMKSECCLLKQNPDPLPCQFLYVGVYCPLSHVSFPLFGYPVFHCGPGSGIPVLMTRRPSIWR